MDIAYKPQIQQFVLFQPEVRPAPEPATEELITIPVPITSKSKSVCVVCPRKVKSQCVTVPQEARLQVWDKALMIGGLGQRIWFRYFYFSGHTLFIHFYSWATGDSIFFLGNLLFNCFSLTYKINFSPHS